MPSNFECELFILAVYMFIYILLDLTANTPRSNTSVETTTEKEMSKAYTNAEALTKEIDIHQENKRKVLARWEKKLQKYEDTALHSPIKIYHTMMIQQMEFKDNLIETLNKELIEFRKKMGRESLKLINNTSDAWKKEIKETHDQYLTQINETLPANLAEIEVRTTENDINWRILKYYGSALEILTQKKNSKIKNMFMGFNDIENERFESIIETFRRKDYNYFTNIRNKFKNMELEYNRNSNVVRKDYIRLREKSRKLSEDKIKLSSSIESLLNTNSNLEKELKELKSQKEINTLICERQKLQEALKKMTKKVLNNSKCGEKHLLLLSKSTEPISNELDKALKKGHAILRCINLCQKLQTPEEKAELWSNCNKSDSDSLPENCVVPEILSKFFNHICNLEINSKLMDDQINKLNHDNNELKMKIRGLVQKKKKINK